MKSLRNSFKHLILGQFNDLKLKKLDPENFGVRDYDRSSAVSGSPIH